MFGPTVQRLIDSHRSGEEPLSSGHDYRQALELAIALKLSAAEGHRRVTLPLEDRALKAYPHLIARGPSPNDGDGSRLLGSAADTPRVPALRPLRHNAGRRVRACVGRERSR